RRRAACRPSDRAARRRADPGRTRIGVCRAANSIGPRFAPRRALQEIVMEEVELRALIEDVRVEKLPRRSFIEKMVGLGLTAPMASTLLMHAGVANSQPMPAYKPTKR